MTKSHSRRRTWWTTGRYLARRIAKSATRIAIQIEILATTEKLVAEAKRDVERLIAEAAQLAAMLDNLQDYIEETKEAEGVMPCNL